MPFWLARSGGGPMRAALPAGKGTVALPPYCDPNSGGLGTVAGIIDRMLRPSQHPLTDAVAGRVSMPFLPTLAVVIALSAASLFCPSSRPAAPTFEVVSQTAPAIGPTAFAPPAASAIHARAPATLAFAAVYPSDALPAPTVPAEASALPVSHPAVGPRTSSRLASAGRTSCPGRRCVEPAPVNPRRGLDPLAAARVAAGSAEDALVPPLALPFAAVAETLAPAAGVFGQAAGLLRRGAASVTGSVATLAECLP